MSKFIQVKAGSYDKPSIKFINLDHIIGFQADAEGDEPTVSVTLTNHKTLEVHGTIDEIKILVNG